LEKVGVFLLLFSVWLAPAARNSDASPIARLVLKAITVYTAAHGVLQEIFVPPSRVSIQTLQHRYNNNFLPSKLSRYEQINVMLSPFSDRCDDDNNEKNDTTNTANNAPAFSNRIGVHFLEYKPDRVDDRPFVWNAIYFNHGFGASSLSWLPALPGVVDRLGGRVGLAHDACGFGWSDRPDALHGYTSEAAARIGRAVLYSRLNSTNVPIATKNSSTLTSGKSVLLVGHSMGAITTLRMALDLDKTIRQRIVLVAPALGIRLSSSASSTNGNNHRKQKPIRRFYLAPRTVLEAPLVYVLRRVVASKNFWRNGLQLVWGDPKRLSDSDVLRFQWPSIGMGWERGLLRFTRAQLLPTDFTDSALLQQVLELPNVLSVDVIVGSKDKIMRPAQLREFLKAFPRVRFKEMEGLGHDPFEEDVEGFLRTLENLLDPYLAKSGMP
jgi:pimeloyl-ACP methyl ester carboxylesterase